MVNGFHSRRIVIKTRIAKPFPFFRLAKDQDQEQGQASSFFSKGTCLHLVVVYNLFWMSGIFIFH